MAIADSWSRDRTVEVLAATLCQSGRTVAERLEAEGTLLSLENGEPFIEQGGSDQFIYVVLFGEVDVRVNLTKRVKVRFPGDFVGEMAMLEPSKPRSASCVAQGPSLVMRWSYDCFIRVASDHPSIWRDLATDLSGKVREYTGRIRHSNLIANLFIGSSAEAFDVAHALKARLKAPDLSVTLWPDIFRPGKYTLEAILQQAEVADFAVLVLAADDLLAMRGRRSTITRDNVLFELGVFVNALGRERAFALSEEGVGLRVLTDIDGVTRLTYSRHLGWRSWLPVWLRGLAPKSSRLDLEDTVRQLEATFRAGPR